MKNADYTIMNKKKILNEPSKYKLEVRPKF